MTAGCATVTKQVDRQKLPVWGHYITSGVAYFCFLGIRDPSRTLLMPRRKLSKMGNLGLLLESGHSRVAIAL